MCGERVKNQRRRRRKFTVGWKTKKSFAMKHCKAKKRSVYDILLIDTRTRNSWCKAESANIFSLHSLGRVFKKRTRSFFFIVYPDKHRELAMDLLQAHNIARGRRFHRIRHITQSRGKLSRSHAHHVESLHTSRNFPHTRSRINYPRQCDQSKLCKSFTTRSIIKLCFIRKNEHPHCNWPPATHSAWTVESL